VIAIPSRLAGNVASGHDDSLEPTSDWTFDILAGTGALRSTLRDLLRFVDAVCDHSSSIASIIRREAAPAWRNYAFDARRYRWLPQLCQMHSRMEARSGWSATPLAAAARDAQTKLGNRSDRGPLGATKITSLSLSSSVRDRR